MRRVRGTATQESQYLLAEAYLHNGQAEEGLRVLPEGPIGSWLKGELLLQKEFKVQGSKFQVENPQSAFRNPQSEAEACFLKAIDIARRQEAKSLELRAAMSLARLWQQQGKTSEAHQLLALVYRWFTEGFDTKDLQEAKALIEGLSY